MAHDEPFTGAAHWQRTVLMTQPKRTVRGRHRMHLYELEVRVIVTG